MHAAPTAPRPDASGMLRGDTEAQARAVVARTCAGVTGLVCQPRAGLGLVARRP